MHPPFLLHTLPRTKHPPRCDALSDPLVPVEPPSSSINRFDQLEDLAALDTPDTPVASTISSSGAVEILTVLNASSGALTGPQSHP